MVPKYDNNINGKDCNDDDNNDTNKGNSRGGPRSVIVLVVVSSFTDFSTEMILGILPPFIMSCRGSSKSSPGSKEGSAELKSYAFRMIPDTPYDEVGHRKSFIIMGYTLNNKPFFVATS